MDEEAVTAELKDVEPGDELFLGVVGYRALFRARVLEVGRSRRTLLVQDLDPCGYCRQIVRCDRIKWVERL